MGNPLRVGVVGLGRRWRRRYRPALRALRERFEVRLVSDPVPLRATREARRLGCRAAGTAALVQGDDIDVVLLAGAPWFRLWPLELACRSGKPVFSACPLELDEAHADALRQQVRDSRLSVMVEMAPRFAAVTGRLREVLETQLGPPRLLLCESVQPARGPLPEGTPVLPGVALVDWCCSLLGGEPVSAVAFGRGVPGFAGLFLDFGGGKAAQITRRSVPGGRRRLGLRVVAERGVAGVDLPGRVRWTGPDGGHVHTLGKQPPAGRVLLEQLHDALSAGRPPQPGLEDAYRVLQWLRAARRSLEEGRRIEFAAPTAGDGSS